MTGLQILGVPGIPEIVAGTDLAGTIAEAAAAAGMTLADGDIVVVTSKIVSKAEGRVVELADVEPSTFALEWSTKWDKDPAVTEVVLPTTVTRSSRPWTFTRSTANPFSGLW